MSLPAQSPPVPCQTMSGAELAALRAPPTSCLPISSPIMELLCPSLHLPNPCASRFPIRAGLLGLTGSNDLRTVIEGAGKGEPRSQLGLDMFVRRVRKYIGAYMAMLDGQVGRRRGEGGGVVDWGKVGTWIGA